MSATPYKDRKYDENHGGIEYGAMEFQRKIEAALDEIRPMLAMDGGGIDLLAVDSENRRVTIRLTGACSGCPSAKITLKRGVEQIMRQRVPEIQEIYAA